MSDHPSTALVTGASSGIGKACALALLAEGWQVALVGRREDALRAVASAAPDRALVLTGDVGDAASVKAMFAKAQARWSHLDLLFNNAGVFTPGVLLEDLPFEHWRSSVAANLDGSFLCTQQAFAWMKSQQPMGGRIINNGSISAHAPRPNSVAYTATKHAITGLTKAASLDGRKYNIAVGQIDIGNVATDMTERMATGVMQADGSIQPEPRMAMDAVVSTFMAMARLPLSANVLNMTVMATAMPFVGRG
jgi:NAD(P)-dependent dehydrogenase (short-subunit alcohol dehydrogenase family)